MKYTSKQNNLAVVGAIIGLACGIAIGAGMKNIGVGIAIGGGLAVAMVLAFREIDSRKK